MSSRILWHLIFTDHFEQNL